MLYVGLDVHQRSSMLCVLDAQGNERERRSVTGHPRLWSSGCARWACTVLEYTYVHDAWNRLVKIEQEISGFPPPGRRG